MSEEKPESKPDPADEVLAIIVYKGDPHCMTYRFEVRSEYNFDDPLHLEQLTVMHDLIDKYLTASRDAVLNKTLISSRDLRRSQKEYYDNLAVKPGEAN